MTSHPDAQSQSRSNMREGLDTLKLAANDYRAWIVGVGSWLANTGYNHFHQNMPWLTSAFHGFTNMANSPLFTPDFHNLEHSADVIGISSQVGLYVLAGLIASNALVKVGEHLVMKQNGELPIKVADGVIMADFDGGLPISDRFASAIQSKDKAKNLILARVSEEHPQRTSGEKRNFKNWAAEEGTQSSTWLDSEFWLRAGAKTAKTIILNNTDTEASLLASVVIREQVGNKMGDIIVIDNDYSLERASQDGSVVKDEHTGAVLVNPYLSITKSIVEGIVGKDADMFLPHDRKQRLKEKENIINKLKTVSDKPKIYLDGNTDEGEGHGLLQALLCYSDMVSLTSEPENADVILHFGTGKIDDDIKALKRPKKSEKVLTLALPFFEDNEDTAVSNGFDGTVSMQHSLIETLSIYAKPNIQEGWLARTKKKIAHK